jgi:hypothetical protein
MRRLRCPVCKKPLTKKEFDAALGILETREQHFHGEAEILRRKLATAEERRKEAKQTGRREGQEAERQRTTTLLRGKDRTITALQDRIRQLKRGTTPQTEGLEFEDELTARLRREFRDDQIIPKGKGGDVLHVVLHGTKEAGRIIYECKRTPGISGAHIRQAAAAKQFREADFAMVVTTGTKKGFSGLAEMNGVLVVAPLGVIPLVRLLRSHIIEIVRANIVREKRALVAQKLLKYITSPQFRNPIEEVTRTAGELQEMIWQEWKDHKRVWEKRRNYYQRIRWDSTQVEANVTLVLQGKEPKAIVHQKSTPLQLPAAHGRTLVAKAGG